MGMKNIDERKSSSDEEEVKLRSSSEEEKLRSSSEEDEKRGSGEFEGKKRAITNEEASFEIKRAKKDIPVEDRPIGEETDELENDSETSTDEDDSDSDDEYEGDDLSEFTRKEVESIPVKPEEIKVELNDEEKIHFYYSIGGENRMPYTKRVSTFDELKEMRRIIKANEFDVPYFSRSWYVGTHRTNLRVEEDAILVCQCAKVALKFYNKKNGTDYVLERLVKCMARPCAVMVYCITFKAKSEREYHTINFQAKTWVKYTYDVHIMMCRIEPGAVAKPLLEAEKVHECN